MSAKSVPVSVHSKSGRIVGCATISEILGGGPIRITRRDGLSGTTSEEEKEKQLRAQQGRENPLKKPENGFHQPLRN